MSHNFGYLWRIADVASGAPCLDQSGVIVQFIAGRFVGGDTIEELADDYGVKTGAIEAALRLVLFARGTNLWERRAAEKVDSVIPLLPARRRRQETP